MADNSYRQKLEDFFKKVPETKSATMINNASGYELWGEVLSGSPIIRFEKGKKNAEEVTSALQGGIVNNPVFTELTTLTHSKLLTNWQSGGQLTSCNAFVGEAAKAVGVKGLGGFYVQETMIAMGKQHCWITPLSGEKPQFGDVFETRSHTKGNDYLNLHVGISLRVDGDTWHTIEGGQGGPGSGVDKVARVRKKYNTAHLLGWVDMRLLASGQPPLPDWLIGNWMIYAGERKYIYTFTRYGEVFQKMYQPSASQGDANAVPTLDTGKLLPPVSDTFQLRWEHEGIETFTYDRWNSFPGLNERMSGIAQDKTEMKGVKL